MANTVKVTDEDGVEHWTALGSALHQRLTRDEAQEVRDASNDAAPGDGDNPPAVNSGSGDGEAGDAAAGRRGRRAGKAEPDPGREQQ